MYFFVFFNGIRIYMGQSDAYNSTPSIHNNMTRERICSFQLKEQIIKAMNKGYSLLGFSTVYQEMRYWLRSACGYIPFREVRWKSYSFLQIEENLPSTHVLE